MDKKTWGCKVSKEMNVGDTKIPSDSSENGNGNNKGDVPKGDFAALASQFRFTNTGIECSVIEQEKMKEMLFKTVNEMVGKYSIKEISLSSSLKEKDNFGSIAREYEPGDTMELKITFLRE